MTHTGPVPGEFTSESKPVENGAVVCHCGSNDVVYRDWESSCGGYEDTCYKCNNCGRIWWVEGIDS